MDQVSTKYADILQCKALQNLPQFGFFGLKTDHLATLVSAAAAAAAFPRQTDHDRLESRNSRRQLLNLFSETRREAPQ
jgi:hypothetical protein